MPNKDTESRFTLDAAYIAAVEHLTQRIADSRGNKNLHWAARDRWAIEILLRQLGWDTE